MSGNNKFIRKHFSLFMWLVQITKHLGNITFFFQKYISTRACTIEQLMYQQKNI